MLQRDGEGRLIQEIKPLEGMRRVIFERMHRSKLDYPQGTGAVRIDVTKVIEFREELKAKDTKVTFGDIYVKAAACALEENMEINASRQGDSLIYYKDINLNVMASFNGILMQPVLSNVDKKDIEEVSAELKQIYANLQKGKLMKVKLDGGTFSVSNLGSALIDNQQPFLSPPQGGILGISRNCRVPAFGENDEIIAQNLTTFSLTIDHGLVDGTSVTGYFASLNKVLQDPWTYMYKKNVHTDTEEG